MAASTQSAKGSAPPEEDAVEFSAVNRALAQPASFIARGGAYLLAVCVSGGLAWAAAFDVGDWVTAEGDVFPASELPIAEAVYGGVVMDLPVRDGDWIAAGATIVTIKSDRLLELRRELLQREEELEIADDAAREVENERIPALDAEEEAKRHRLSLIEQLAQSLVERREAFRASILSERENLQGRVKLAERSVSVLGKLSEKGLVAENRMLEVEQTVLESFGRLTQLDSREREREAEFDEQNRRLDLEAATLREDMQRLAETRRQSLSEARAVVRTAKIARDRAARAVEDLDDLSFEASGADDQATRYLVTAPADGAIIDMEIVNPGQTVDPGQIIARIVPDGSEMRVRINVANRDVSKLTIGDAVRFKVDAYQFTRHGVLTGTVDRLAPAVRANDRDGSFTAEVRLDQDYFVIDGERRALSPGLKGTVDIKVGEERLISRLFNPLKVLFEPKAAQP